MFIHVTVERETNRNNYLFGLDKVEHKDRLADTFLTSEFQNKYVRYEIKIR
jgi:hypothetical protein